jgi:hypothetical protein
MMRLASAGRLEKRALASLPAALTSQKAKL